MTSLVPVLFLGLSVLVGPQAVASLAGPHNPPPAAGVPAGPDRASTEAAPSVVPAVDPGGTVWLCRPGDPADPCDGDLDATAVSPTGAMLDRPAAAASSPAFDCFYVYPTVSREKSANADLRVQRSELGVAMAQAARFSQVCNVWAPIYRQRTAASLAQGLGSDPQADTVAYESLLSAWRDYLANDNDGRPVVFIGHSQGAAVLIRLLQHEVDPDPALRARMVSAIILGGNVAVPVGATVGGTFSHLPVCRSSQQDGCVIAYSSFPGRPPLGSPFGRPGTGVSLQSAQTAKRGLQVVCTNPADLGGGSGLLDPYFLSIVSGDTTLTTPWVEYPGLYRARCETGAGASWLDVTRAGSGHDVRPLVTEVDGPAWGYHADDVNLALGNLVSDVASEEAAFETDDPAAQR